MLATLRYGKGQTSVEFVKFELGEVNSNEIGVGGPKHSTLSLVIFMIVFSIKTSKNLTQVQIEQAVSRYTIFKKPTHTNTT